MDVEWFYVDANGQQAGPVSIADLKGVWSRKELTDASLVWNANMAGWQAVEVTPDLKRQLPTTASAPAAAAAPAPAASAPAPAPRPAMGGGGFNPSSILGAQLKKGQPSHRPLAPPNPLWPLLTCDRCAVWLQ